MQSSGMRAGLVEEGGGGEPHPVGAVDGGVAVDEQPVKRVAPALPRHVQVAPRQEAGLRAARPGLIPWAHLMKAPDVQQYART